MDRQIRKSTSRKFCSIIYITPIYLQYKTLFFQQKLSTKKKQLAVNINGTPVAEITCVFSTTNVLLKYSWAVSCKDNNTAVELRLQRVEKN